VQTTKRYATFFAWTFWREKSLILLTWVSSTQEAIKEQAEEQATTEQQQRARNERKKHCCCFLCPSRDHEENGSRVANLGNNGSSAFFHSFKQSGRSKPALRRQERGFDSRCWNDLLDPTFITQVDRMYPNLFSGPSTWLKREWMGIVPTINCLDNYCFQLLFWSATRSSPYCNPRISESRCIEQ